MIQEEIVIKRLAHPFSRDIDEVYRIYSDCFPIRDEKEPKRTFRETAGGRGNVGRDRYSEDYLVATLLNGRVVGGSMFNFLQYREVAFGVGWYLFIDSAYRGDLKIGGRRINLGLATLESVTEILRSKAAERGVALRGIFGETNDPGRMTPEEVEADRAVKDQRSRLRFLDRFGFRAVDPRYFAYYQPQLNQDKKPYEGLMLLMKPLDRSWREGITIDDLLDVIYTLIWGAFDGVPGSCVNGHRDPDTDATYRRMKRQLLSLKSSGTECLKLTRLVGKGRTAR